MLDNLPGGPGFPGLPPGPGGPLEKARIINYVISGVPPFLTGIAYLKNQIT